MLWTSILPAWANPTGEVVVGGAASFNRPDTSTLIVNQQTDRAVINWNNFSIANGELTRFVQPSATSAALNRVVTLTPSLIEGALQANGQVLLSNPNGIMVGKNGTINVGSFIASTHDIQTDDFMRNGNLILQGDSEAAILNQGSVTAREGDVFLVAREVRNEGQLMARDGTVGLVSGTEVSLMAKGQGNYKVRLWAAEKTEENSESGIRNSEKDAEIVNEGVIEAANAVLETTGSYLPMAIKNTGVIQATGILHNEDGTVTLTGGAGDVLNTGVVAALQRSLDGQKEQGGSVLMGGKNVTSELGSIVTASGNDGGGTVKLRAEEKTILRGSIEVVGVSDDAKGGKVQLLGEKVGMLEGAKVDASGGAGGGEVLVGGDYLGRNPAVPNAQAVVMAPTAEIRADATANGDGGKVILWSDNYTAFFGEITALGGPSGGNGGFVETSSANSLLAYGRVEASAFAGQAGSWLLDPGDITINNTGPTTEPGFNDSNPDLFVAPSPGSVVLAAEINNALNEGTSVTIRTDPYANTYTSADYTITVNAPITKTAQQAVVLTLQATGGIIVNQNITSSSNELYMIFNADLNNNGGAFTLANGVTLNSNGGFLDITASDIVLGTVGSSIVTARSLSGGGGTVAGDVFLRPSLNGTTGRSIGIGSGAGTFSISNAELGIVNPVGTLASGTITIGSRAAGLVTLGTTAPVSAGGKNVSILTGGNIVDDGASAAFATTGLLTLNAGGVIGTAASGTSNQLNLNVARLKLLTGGSFYNVATAQQLTQLAITTDGLATSQIVSDLNNNLTLSVRDDNLGNTTISALRVASGNVEFFYENTGLGILGGGDVTISAPAGATGNNRLFRNVQLATAGYGTLNGVYRDLEIRAPLGTISVLSPLFSGGGNITLAAQDFFGTPPSPGQLQNTAAASTDTYFASGAVINTFRSTSSGSTNTATFGSRFQLRAADNGFSGSISGQGGMLTLEPLSASAAGREVVLSRFDSILAYPNTFNISWDESVMMEAPAIRIGGVQTGDIRIQPLSEFAGGGFRSVDLDNVGATVTITTTQRYVPRYFEQPFFNATRNNGDPRGPDDGIGIPHVTGGFVSFVSALGEVRNLPGGDVNISTLSLTGVDGVFFDGRGGGNYAETDDYSSIGSIVGRLAGRVGRTVEDVAVGSGGDYSVYLPISGINVVDGRNVTGSGSDLLVNQQALASARQVGGSVTTLISTSGVNFVPVVSGGTYQSAPTLFFTGGGGAGASATAVMGVQATVTNGGSGYATGDTITFLGGGGSGASFQLVVVGGQITGFTVSDTGSNYLETPTYQIQSDTGTGAVIDVSLFLKSVSIDSAGIDYASAPNLGQTGGTPITPATFGTAELRGGGGGSYTSSPTVNFYGGGIEQASARAILEDGQVALVVPQVVGLGYASAPDITLLDPSGRGSGATAQAFVNGRGQLTPFDVLNPGDGYTTPPTVVLQGGLATGGRAAVARAEVSGYVKDTIQVTQGGGGYATVPTVTITGGGGVGARATAIVSGGIVTGIRIDDPGYGYTSNPSVIISGGGGSGATAAAAIGRGVTGLYIVDPGSGYISAPTIVLLGGGAASEANVRVSSGYQFLSSGTPFAPIRVTNPGSGYVTAPEVVVSGGGIAHAQARAILDKTPTSLTFGQVIGYELTNPGEGYRSNPNVLIGYGEVFGNFGEYGVSTEQVDRNRASGNITLDAFDAVSTVATGISFSAPVRTGDAYGGPGTSALTGSILLDSAFVILANPDRGADGILITGDAIVQGGFGGTQENARSGSITLAGYSITNLEGSRLQRLSGSDGLPVQIGVAQGASIFNVTGSLLATLVDRTTLTGVGDLKIYAPAPGQIEAAQGGAPLDPNHPVRLPRSSNDLAITGLRTEAQVVDDLGNILPDSSLVIVEVGGQEGLLTLLPKAPSSAIATVTNGAVTLIVPEEGGQLFAEPPEVIITGGGIVPADAAATISGGTITQIVLNNGGSGYFSQPTVTITGGGGAGASVVAVINESTGQITGINIVNPGYGYTTLPTVTISGPSGAPATATGTISGFILTGATITSPGSGYTVPPLVTISGGFFGTATATAIVSNGQVTGIQVQNNSDVFFNPATITISPSASQASALANLTNGEVTSFTIVTPGGGYSGIPSVFYNAAGADPYNLDIDRLGLFADRIQIFDQSTPASLLITAASAAVGPFTNQHPVNAGTKTAGSTSLEIGELNRFNVGDLVIGRRQEDEPTVGAGVITVSVKLEASGLRVTNGIVLAGTREVADQGGTTGLSLDQVTIDAGGSITLTGSGNSSRYFSAIIRDSGLSGQVPVEKGLQSRPASITLYSQLRSVNSVLAPLTLAEIFVDVPEFTGRRFYQGITTQNGDVTILADQIAQTPLVGWIHTTGLDDAIPVTTATVTLAPYTSGRAISLYSSQPTSGTLSLRVGNSQYPGLELIEASTLVLGSTTTSRIDLNTDLIFNYLAYPDAPINVSLVSQGAITANTSQIVSTSRSSNAAARIRVGSLTVNAGGAVALAGLNDVDSLSAVLTGAGAAGNFSFRDLDGLELGQFSLPGVLSITAGGSITQTTAGISAGGTATFTAGSGLINLGSSGNQFTGPVSAANNSGGITVVNSSALTLGTVTAGGGGALSLTGTGGVSGSSPITAGNATISAGAGAISLANAANEFTGTVNLSNNGGFAITLLDATALTIGTLSSSGSASLTAGSSLWFDTPTNYSSFTGSLTASAGTTITVSDSMTSLSGVSSFLAGTSFTLSGSSSLQSSGNGSVILQGDSISLGSAATAVTANGGITLRPATNSKAIGIQDNTVAGALAITEAMLQQLASTGTVTIGRSTGTGVIDIGSLGAVDLSGEANPLNAYSLNLANSSGGVDFNFSVANSLTLPNGKTFDLSIGTSNVNGGAGTDIQFGVGGTGDGTISFSSAGTVNSFTGRASRLGASNLSGNFDYTSSYARDLQVGQISVAGTTIFTLPSARSLIADNPANTFTGQVTVRASSGTLQNVTLNNARALQLSDLDLAGNFSSVVTNGGLSLAQAEVVGNFAADAVGIRSAGKLVVGGGTSLAANAGDIDLTNENNDFGTSLTINSARDISLFVPVTDDVLLGTNPSIVNATGTFVLLTGNGNQVTLGGADPGAFYLSSAQLARFSVNTFAPVATGANLVVAGPFSFSGIPNLSLNTVGSGDVLASGAASRIAVNTLSINSAGKADIDALSGGVAQNRIYNLGTVVTGGGRFRLINAQGMNLRGTVTTAGDATLTIAGQFYNYSGTGNPFGGVNGVAEITSLSMFGGMPSQISALANFRNGYYFQNPGGNRRMIYAVAPFTMFAPGGTVIAGIDLSGVNTGGAQFDTFRTGANNLDWMIADFGRFSLPKVRPARLEYMLYPQRVEPETRSLPAPMMGQLTRELGRPPTLEEIQKREIANRAAARMRTGAILERSSFDEPAMEAQESAQGPTGVLDGGIPQAKAIHRPTEEAVEAAAVAPKVESVTQDVEQTGGSSPEAASSADNRTVERAVAETVPTARKQTDTGRDPSGSMLRPRSQRAVALRLDSMDPIKVIEEERERAEVHVAPPVAGK